MIQPPIVYQHVVMGLMTALGATVFLLAGFVVWALAASYLRRRL